MTRTSWSDAASDRRRLLPIFALAFLLVVPLATVGASSRVSAVPLAGTHPAGAHPAATPHPLNSSGSSAFNPPCYKIDLGVCVSIANYTETNIVPPTGSFVSASQPNATSDLQLIIKSQTRLDWQNAPRYGPDAPIALNVSGVLWNGDPYYSVYSASVWHSDSATNWWTGPTLVPQNTSGYVYWYSVTISAKSSNNVPNFYPGMSVTWWIALTYNVSNVYVHREGPHFQYTYSGAWPFSPYPGSSQYAGTSATFEDINLTVNPRTPNVNDTVTLTLNTTQADALTNATIGKAWVDVDETSPLGLPIQNGTFTFPVSVANSFGATSTNATIPAGYAQVAGAVVTYQLTVFDVAGDQIVTPLATYVVGANGSFLSGIFVDDLFLASHPTSVAASAAGSTMLTPGTVVNFTLLSRNPGTAINAAEIDYTVSYPLLHEVVRLSTPMVRNSSTVFLGTIPGLPLGAFVNFTVLAWDFTDRLEISPGYGYYMPDFTTYDPVVEPNSTFFYVFVYDNGTHTWVQGAQVQVVGPGGIFNSVANTSLGLAYPNQTKNPYLPLLLPANTSYRVAVRDPWFVPASGSAPDEISVSVQGLPDLATRGPRQTLVVAPTYYVVQEANAIVFWLNATQNGPVVSPPVAGGTVPLAAILGLGATLATAVVLGLWWKQIRDKRKAEERRITL